MKPPVFIVGCPRSGTSFLYHLLLSAGGFAEFHTQMNVYDVLQPIYGDLGVLKHRRKMMREWLQSKAFEVSGLNAEEIETEVLTTCRSAGDFLRMVMDGVARRQNVDRWADSTPTNAPHMFQIARDFPEARFVHIIRDARDVVLSLDKRGWSRPLPWDKSRALLADGLYWEWIVRMGRRHGAVLGPRYMEVRYEDLVERPRATLPHVAAFLQHDLDYDRIQRNRIGSIRKPLTSFEQDLKEGHFSPVGRWKEKFPRQQLAWFESLVGDYLQELGYALSGSVPRSRDRLAVHPMRLAYRVYHDSKQWVKNHTRLSRFFVNYSAILIDK